MEKQEIWVTLQIGENELSRNYIIGGEIENIEDINWQEQIESMAESLANNDN